MLGMLCKILAKSIRLDIHPHKHAHSSPFDFIGVGSVLDNIVAVQLGIQHAQVTLYEIAMIQLDFIRAFNVVGQNFIQGVKLKTRFGMKLYHAIFLL